MTMRRYFVTVTPGTETGYWNAMNSPIRERSSGAAWVMSSPSNRIWPSLTSSVGWPMIALASVDLPEPLGPMSAWISPERTVRSSPLRICLSPTATWRFLISSSGMKSWVRGSGRGDGLARRRGLGGERDEVGQGRLLQCLEDAALHPGP